MRKNIKNAKTKTKTKTKNSWLLYQAALPCQVPPTSHPAVLTSLKLLPTPVQFIFSFAFKPVLQKKICN
jgi:hypothetical protein